MIGFTEGEMAEARRMLLKSIAVLTFDAVDTHSLSARNIMFHAEELMKALDAFYAGREPADE